MSYSFPEVKRSLVPIQSDRLKGLFEANLPQDVRLFNEFHALLVEVGKKHCRKAPVCAGCPLEHLEHTVE